MAMNELHIDTEEVLRYLQMPLEKVDEGTLQQLEDTKQMLKRLIAPSYVQRCYPLCIEGNRVQVEDTGIAFISHDLAAHLKDCHKAYFIAATLGLGVDRQLAYLKTRDVMGQVMLDAVASVAIEDYIEQLNDAVRRKEREEGCDTAMRYSPGYGDFPLEDQEKMMLLTNATKRAGIHLLPSLMMLPCKSVTAIIGVSNTPQKQEYTESKCSRCQLREHCRYRQQGQSCGKDKG